MTTSDKMITVKLQECANVKANSDAVKVCVDSINDSRCPVNARCIWAGYAAATLRATVNNKVYTLKLSTINRNGFPPKDTTIANHRFQLSNVLPYPGDGTNVSPRVELQID